MNLRQRYLLTEKSLNNMEQSNNINWDSVLSTAKSYMDFVESDKYHEDNNYDNYIFEEVMMAVYGNDVFKKLEL